VVTLSLMAVICNLATSACHERLIRDYHDPVECVMAAQVLNEDPVPGIAHNYCRWPEVPRPRRKHE